MAPQGWALQGDDGRSPRVYFVDFKARNESVFHAIGPYTADEVFAHPLMSDERLPVLDPGPVESADDHIKRVKQTIEIIREKKLRKVVIARREDMVVKLDRRGVFDQLCTTYPDALVYLWVTEGECWMGATPETLFTADESHIHTMALAGTRRVEGGSWTDKEYDEQLAVTESITETLLKLGAGRIDTRGPGNHAAGPVEHLVTHIDATRPVSGYPIDWARRLHPTPAVCGMPQQSARQVISEVENFDRNRYAGYFGFETDEAARFYVNLRCMQVGQNRVALYAGGGITAQSDSQSEWEETVHKLQTLKAVIQPERP